MRYFVFAVVAVGLILSTGLSAAPTDSDEGVSEGSLSLASTDLRYSIEQNGLTLAQVTPLAGELDAVSFYDYDQSTASANMGLKRSDASILFLYAGPDGMSLVMVHDSGDGTGGSVDFSFTELPVSQGDWVVGDDWHTTPPDIDGTDDIEPTWLWDGCCTDGGVFRGGLDGPFNLRIEPRFNESSSRWSGGMGHINEWIFLTGSIEAPTEVVLDMESSLEIIALDAPAINVPADLVSAKVQDRLEAAAHEQCPGSQANTLGYTTDDRSAVSCSPVALDRELIPGERVHVHVDIGDFNAVEHFEDGQPMWLALSAELSARPTNSQPREIAELFLNGILAGGLQWNGEGLCLWSVGRDCDSSVRLDSSQYRLPPGVQNVAVEVNATLPDGFPNLTVNAVALELKAPPTFMIHGWNPVPNDECLFWGFRWDSDYARYRDELMRRIRTEANLSFGQDPWIYRSGLDETFDTRFSYCSTYSYIAVAPELNKRISHFRTYGYEGPSWIVAHSMGGLASRWMLEVDEDPPWVTKLVTFATPHHGSCYADYVAPLVPFEGWDSEYLPVNSGVLGMRSSGWQIEKLTAAERAPGTEYGVIAALWPSAMPCANSLATPQGPDGDAVVPYASAAFEGSGLDVYTVNCAVHSRGRGLEDIGPAIYDVPETAGYIARELFGPTYQYSGQVRPMVCPAPLDVSSSDSLVGGWLHAIGGQIARLRPFGLVLPEGITAQQADAAEDALSFHAASPTLNLTIMWNASHPVPSLELTDPEGNVRSLSSQVEGGVVQPVDVFNVSIAVWQIPDGVAGTWTGTDVVGNTPWVLLVGESGPAGLDVLGPSSLMEGQDASFDLVVPSGAIPVSANVAVRGLDGTRDASVTANSTGWTVSTTSLEHGDYQLEGSVMMEHQGDLYERAVFGEFTVYQALDWSVSGAYIKQNAEWWGATSEVGFTVCSLGSSAPSTEFSFSVVRDGAVIATGRGGEGLEASGCAKERVHIPAWPCTCDNLTIKIHSLHPERTSENNAVTLPFYVARSRATLVEGVSETGWATGSLSLRSYGADTLLYPIECSIIDNAGNLIEFEANGTVASLLPSQDHDPGPCPEDMWFDDGSYRVQWRANDTGELEPVRDLVFTSDTRPPEVQVYLGGILQQGDVIGAKPGASLYLTARDPSVNGIRSGLLSGWWSLERILSDGSTETLRAPGPYGDWFELANEGKYLLRLDAKDHAGHHVVRTVEVYIDGTPPTMNWLIQATPVNGAYKVPIGTRWGVEGSDNVGIQEITMDVIGPGGEIVQHEHTDESLITGYFLYDGGGSFLARVVDLAGNKKEVLVPIVVDALAPSLRWISPGPTAACGAAVSNVLTSDLVPCPAPPDQDRDGFADLSEVHAGSRQDDRLWTPGTVNLATNPGFEEINERESPEGWSSTGRRVQTGAGAGYAPPIEKRVLMLADGENASQRFFASEQCGFRGLSFDATSFSGSFEIALDLKTDEGVTTVRRTVTTTDGWDRHVLLAHQLGTHQPLEIGCPVRLAITFNTEDWFARAYLDNVLVAIGGPPSAQELEYQAERRSGRQVPYPPVSVVHGVVKVELDARDTMVRGTPGGISCVVLKAEDDFGRTGSWDSCKGQISRPTSGRYVVLWNTSQFKCSVKLTGEAVDLFGRTRSIDQVVLTPHVPLTPDLRCGGHLLSST